MAAGVYLHIPFCKSRCSYCDFATDVYRSSDAVERYVAALCKEIETFPEQVITTCDSGWVNVNIDTIYFGGGTPSLLDAAQVEAILKTVRNTFAVDASSEITMEMNPATVTPETLEKYRKLGVNRASFGVQTFDDTELKRLARGHNAQDARDTFRMLRDAGFENVGFDLIAGLPRQTLADWERNLDEALTMQPEHLSLYLLEIHESTPLAEQIKSERQPLPDEELAAEMYELMLDKVAAAGYRQYEISNFARPGFESRHNSKYWLLDPVYGFGVSAHSYNGVERYANDRDTNAYVATIESGASPEVMREEIDTPSEYIFLGLRLNRGIDLDAFRARFGSGLETRFAAELDDLSDKGLLSIDGGRLFLTEKGMLFSNEVFAAFV
ncbi:MAG: radical SAM family heme chaperone HemW [Acidobacteriota bacterium]